MNPNYVTNIAEILHREIPEKKKEIKKVNKNLLYGQKIREYRKGYNQAIDQCHSAIDRVLGKE